MKVFNSNEFKDKLLWLVNDVPNVYWSEIGTWDTLWNGLWRMDCVTSIKGLLWGFRADANEYHGGADYKSNGVTDDFTANGGIDHCSDVSQDFSNLQVGEYLCMWGTEYEHCGVYLGNGKVFECTVEWNTGKCIISNIDGNGTRTYNGMGSPANWTWHGKLEYIDYVNEPTPTEYKIGDEVEINGVYISSDSTEMLQPAITTGTITNIIYGARNPYLLNDGNLGWVNNECIIGLVNPPEPEPTPVEPTAEEKLQVVKEKLQEIINYIG